MADDDGSLAGFIRGINDRVHARNIENAQRNFLTDPQGAIAAVNAVKGGGPEAAFQLQQRQEAMNAQNDADATQKQTRYLGAVKNMAAMLSGARDKGGDVGTAFDSITPVLKNGLGMNDGEIGQWKNSIVANPGLIDTLQHNANEKLMNIAAGGAVVDPVTGQPLYKNDGVAKPISIKRGDGGTDVYIYDPTTKSMVLSGGAPNGTSGGATSTAATGSKVPLTADAMEPYFKAQESGGDYTAVNKSTGALGAHQVMPVTAMKLAKSLNLPWNSGLMVSNTPEGRQYQDQIGAAARKEAIDASGGDPAKAFSYYYSGSPTAYLNPQKNPKTAKYVQDMLARTGAGTPQNQTNGPTPVISTPGKPVKPDWRPATTEEKVAAGVDPALPFQRSPDGEMKPTGPTGKGSPFQGNSPKSQLAGQMLSLMQGSRDIVNNNLDEAIKGANGWTTGLTGSALSRVPGTEAYNFAQTLSTIKANIAIDKLQEMRNNSKTGGALGNVSDKDMALLQATLGSVDLAQSPDKLVQNLRRIKQLYAKVQTSLKADTTDVTEGTVIKNPATGARMRMHNGQWEKM